MKNNELNFLGFEIVDEDGIVLGTDPRDFPVLLVRAAEVVATIQTGKIHRAVNVDWEKLRIIQERNIQRLKEKKDS